MRLIDADALKQIKFHPLPYTHIVPTDCEVESYERGWNDAVDAVVEYAPTIEPKHGRWIDGYYCSILYDCRVWRRFCSVCEYERDDDDPDKDTNYCPNCGARMESE